MRKPIRLLMFIAIAFPFLLLGVGNARAQSVVPVVRAVLFYSPTCPHCEYVITETLPPLFEQYGDQFQLARVNVNTIEGQSVFLAALDHFGLERSGVPFLMIDDQYLIGSVDIPGQLPGLIEFHLARGGVDWPDLPGLGAFVAERSAAAASAAQPELQPPSPEPRLPVEPLTWRDRFAADPAGNTIAVLVLAAMLAAFVFGAMVLAGAASAPSAKPSAWLVPVLCGIGMAVAAYLAYVETAQVTAVCGPVGDCNTVQQSEYARLFGLLPIGILGLFGYVAILLAWVAARLAPLHISRLAALVLVAMTVGGTLLSLYLTFLEPFVIGATCAWCLTSAVVMTILMLLTVRPVKHLLSDSPDTTTRRRRRSQSSARRSF